MTKYITGRHLGIPLTCTFALLIAFILGGNGLLIWQFRMARQQTDGLAVVSNQMMAILRLQYFLVSFHKSLDEVVEEREADALSRWSEQQREDLLEQLRQTRKALSRPASDRPLEMRFLPILDSIEIGFPHQLHVINSLAAASDWRAVNYRVAQLKPIEIEITSLAKRINADYNAELSLSEQNTLRLQDRILFLIPFMALSTFSIANLFAWAIAKRILELQIEERVTERMRIARDLHDTLIQTIQGSKLFAETALARYSDFTSMRVAVDQLVLWLGRATEEGRLLLNSLHDSKGDDLENQIHAIVMDTRAQGTMNVVVSISGDSFKLIPEVQNEIIRIAREALFNAQKHSECSVVEIRLDYSPVFSLTISDNGKGFDLTCSADPAKGHYGLRGMRERAASLGGKLTISSSIVSGTTVNLALPKRALSRDFKGSPSGFIKTA